MCDGINTLLSPLSKFCLLSDIDNQSADPSTVTSNFIATFMLPQPTTIRGDKKTLNTHPPHSLTLAKVRVWPTSFKCDSFQQRFQG